MSDKYVKDELLDETAPIEYEQQKVDRIREFFKTGTQKYVNTLGSVLVLIILFISGFLTIILDGGINIKEFGFSSALIMVCSYIYFLLQYSRGQLIGKRVKENVQAVERYTELKQRLFKTSGLRALEKFCGDYVAEELKQTRIKILSAYNFDYGRYEKEYLNKSRKEIKRKVELTKVEKKVIIRANEVKKLKLCANMIVKSNNSAEHKKLFEKTTQGYARERKSARLIKLIFLSMFGGFIVASMTVNLSLTGLIKALIQIMLTVVGGVFGYRDGYENMATVDTEYRNAQSDLLEEFFNSKGERISSPEVKGNEEAAKQN
jgi:hypothetical protein